MSIKGQSFYINWLLMLEPIGRTTKTMYAERDHLKLCNMYCICNPTCMHCLVNKGQTLIKSNYIKKAHWWASLFYTRKIIYHKPANCTIGWKLPSQTTPYPVKISLFYDNVLIKFSFICILFGNYLFFNPCSLMSHFICHVIFFTSSL
jgi:hypothetical protein